MRGLTKGRAWSLHGTLVCTGPSMRVPEDVFKTDLAGTLGKGSLWKVVKPGSVFWGQLGQLPDDGIPACLVGWVCLPQGG